MQQNNKLKILKNRIKKLFYYSSLLLLILSVSEANNVDITCNVYSLNDSIIIELKIINFKSKNIYIPLSDWLIYGEPFKNLSDISSVDFLFTNSIAFFSKDSLNKSINRLDGYMYVNYYPDLFKIDSKDSLIIKLELYKDPSLEFQKLKKYILEIGIAYTTELELEKINKKIREKIVYSVTGNKSVNVKMHNYKITSSSLSFNIRKKVKKINRKNSNIFCNAFKNRLITECILIDN